jgi:hypothetical protein
MQMNAILKASAGLAAILLTTGSMAQERAKPKDLGILPTAMVAGLADPNGKVPALNGVAGAGVDNLDVAFPQAVLVHGGTYAYTFATQNTTYDGQCTWSYTLTQAQGKGTVTLDSGTFKKDFACKAGSYYAWFLFGKAVANSPGLATLTGTVSFNGKKVTLKTTVRIV